MNTQYFTFLGLIMTFIPEDEHGLLIKLVDKAGPNSLITKNTRDKVNYLIDEYIIPFEPALAEQMRDSLGVRNVCL